MFANVSRNSVTKEVTDSEREEDKTDENNRKRLMNMRRFLVILSKIWTYEIFIT